jgi:glycosyltransferase involved in cell wall biosynthesis
MEKPTINETGRIGLTQQVNTPKVSVCVVTYNQRKYIRQCLQSIVDQETDFNFEVIVADDCSTDGTQSIIQEFADRYPGVLKPIFHETNIGPYKNFIFVHQKAIGEYIAHVDGDDYCLAGKLQAQTNVLDSDPDCNIVWHRMLVETIDGEVKEGALQRIPNLDELKFDRRAIIQYMSIGSNSSKMYRKSVRDFTLPDFDVMDYFANVEQVGNGVARFTGCRPYGVYRLGIGIASGGIKTRQLLAKCFEFFHNKYYDCRLQVNTAALTYFLADLKNCRKTWPMFFVVWIKTFHIGSVSNLLRNLSFITRLRLTN